MQGPPCSMTEHPMTEWSVQVRGAVQTHWDHPYVFSLAFPFRRSRAKAIFLSTIFIWGKWTLTKLEEWLSWGKNHIMYRQCVVVMRGIFKVHTWLVLCKRKTFLKRHTYTHIHTHRRQGGWFRNDSHCPPHLNMWWTSLITEQLKHRNSQASPHHQYPSLEVTRASNTLTITEGGFSGAAAGTGPWWANHAMSIRGWTTISWEACF